MKIVPQVYRVRQMDIENLPREAWCYWVIGQVEKLFNENPSISELYSIDMGLKTSDNFRFVRWWWEIGIHRIANVISREQAVDSGKKWFPYAKGAGGQRYASVVDNVVNWADDGKEVKVFLVEQYPYLRGNTEWCTHNENLYFQPAIVWSAVSSSGFVGRQIPPGVITSNANYGIFLPQEDAPVLLAVMNSLPGRYLIRILCPTINHNKGDIEMFPVPKDILGDQFLYDLGMRTLQIASLRHTISETSGHFRSPSFFFEAKESFDEVKAQIDDIVFRKFGLQDQKTEIKNFMSRSSLDTDELTSVGNDEAEEAKESRFTKIQPASWISYAVGISMGRFLPGIEDALGCAIVESDSGEKHHLFPYEIEKALQELANNLHVAVLEDGHRDDLAGKVTKALELMLDREQIEEIKKSIGGDGHNLEGSLRQYLFRDFFIKGHLKQYQNRPIYWLLQSPKKYYSVYLYHEYVTRDTLPLLRSNRYLGGKINQIRHSIDEITTLFRTAEGREKRRLEKEIDSLSALLTDLEAFDQAIQNVVQARNEYGETVGWAYDIDDGIILNLAPLFELLPSWKGVLKKYWDQLESGEYDWSYTAMRYWPKRVIEKCKSNRSYAIAHNHLDLFEVESH